MAVKTSWHRYGTKLRRRHPMYTRRYQIGAAVGESLTIHSRRLFLVIVTVKIITTTSMHIVFQKGDANSSR